MIEKLDKSTMKKNLLIALAGTAGQSQAVRSTHSIPDTQFIDVSHDKTERENTWKRLSIAALSSFRKFYKADLGELTKATVQVSLEKKTPPVVMDRTDTENSIVSGLETDHELYKACREHTESQSAEEA